MWQLLLVSTNYRPWHWKISVRIFLGFSILLCRGLYLALGYYKNPISGSPAWSHQVLHLVILFLALLPFLMKVTYNKCLIPFLKITNCFYPPSFLCREQGASCHELFSPSPFEEKNKIDWSSCPYALLVPFILWWDMPIKRNTKWSMSNLLEMKRWLRLGSFFRERLLNFAARLVSNFWRANDKWMLLLEYSGSASSL